MILVGIVAPASALGATSRADLQVAYQNALRQAIALLTQEVSQLEAQLATLVAPSIPTALPAAAGPSLTLVEPSSTSSESSSTPTSSAALVATTTPTGTASGGAFGVSGSPFTQTAKMPLQKIGTVTVGASSAGPIELSSLKLTFSGNGYTAGSSTFLNTVSLKDPNAIDVNASFGAVEAKDANAGTIAWVFPVSAGSAPVVSSGQQLVLQLWAATNVIPGVPGTSESLSVTVQNPGDLTFYDGADTAAVAAGSIPLSQTEVPLTVSSLSWGVGM